MVSQRLQNKKIALVHDWLTVPGGAEKVLLALHELFPQVPIFTTIYSSSKFPELENAQVIASYLNYFPGAKSHHQFFLPLMPNAMSTLPLQDYDLIISDSHAVAKGIRKSKNALHICYCHTPFRYVWYPEVDPRLKRFPLSSFLINYLKKWDLETVKRVDYFLANSVYTASRIRQIYQREATVIYPPVEGVSQPPVARPDNYFLYVGRLVAYKKPEIVVEAFNRLGKPLKIVGDGPLRRMLQRKARKNIQFLGRIKDSQLQELYRYCQALIFPAVEDFGIVPVEVMSAGRPVIAYKQGGVLETVKEGVTGEFFSSQTPDAICKAVKNFRSDKYSPSQIQRFAWQFDKKVFQRKILEYLEQVVT